MILFDANVLVHAHAVGSPFHEAARRLRDQAARGELEACLSPQVLCEFVAVSTNERLLQPALTLQQARKEIVTYWTQTAFRHIMPTDQTIPRLVQLMEQHGLGARRIFDTFLVATMLEHRVQIIYTQNTKDFATFQEIQVVNPFEARTTS